MAASLIGGSQGTVQIPRNEVPSLLVANFRDHLAEMVLSYQHFHSDGWNPTSVLSSEEILAENGQLRGYRVLFDSGSVSFRLDGTLIEERIPTDHFGTGAYSGLTDIATLSQQSGFSVSSCLGKIYSLSNQYPSNFWGNWSPISLEENSPLECAQIASADLLYTYKVSGRQDLTKEEGISTLLNDLKNVQRFSENSGTSIGDAVSGLNSFLSGRNEVSMVPASFDGSKPTLTFFSASSKGGFGHCAMTIGKATTNSWWNFKDEWSIVASLRMNYDGYPIPTNRCSGSDQGLFGIKSSYKQGEYSLSFGNC
jgi:hypothetical protein